MKDDRGESDLTKQIDNLKKKVEGYKLLLQMQKQIEVKQQVCISIVKLLRLVNLKT